LTGAPGHIAFDTVYKEMQLATKNTKRHEKGNEKLTGFFFFVPFCVFGG